MDLVPLCWDSVVGAGRVTENFSTNYEFKHTHKETTVDRQPKEAAQIPILLILIMKNPFFLR